MMDVYMTVSLAVIFGLFAAFAEWCGQITRRQGGEDQ